MVTRDIPIDIRGLHDAYARGLDPVQVVDRVFEAIESADDPGIFISLADRKAVRKAAQKLGRFDPAKALWGIPFAVKDNIDAAGLPTTAACPAYSYRPSRDAAESRGPGGACAHALNRPNAHRPAPWSATDPPFGEPRAHAAG